MLVYAMGPYCQPGGLYAEILIRFSTVAGVPIEKFEKSGFIVIARSGATKQSRLGEHDRHEIAPLRSQ